MHIANTDLIQATIEIFGAIICLVVATMVTIMTGQKKKSERAVFFVVLVSAISLFVDAGWYIYDGNTSTIGVVLNRLFNFVIFMCSPLQIVGASNYVLAIAIENGSPVVRKKYMVPHLLGVLALSINLSNIFIKWMYGFDDKNVYYRMNGWYIYTAITALMLLSVGLLVISDRKYIPFKKRIALFFFLISPFIGIILQTTSLGISFFQLGTAAGIIVIVLDYMLEWIVAENERNAITDEKKNFWLIEAVFSVMILCISSSIISCVVSVRSVADKNSRENSMVIANMVSNEIEDSLAEAVVVSRTMAQWDMLHEVVLDDNLEGSDSENLLVDYLREIKEEYGYQMVFMASAKTKSYYTYEGLSRYMDVDNDPLDAWYNDFLSKDVPFELNVDTDKDNGMILCEFVNMRILDEKGNFIGVCGVGKTMDSILETLDREEKKYDIDILLFDSAGLIQIATERNSIEKEYVDTDNLQYVNGNEFYYEKSSTESRLTKYLDDIDMYLLVLDHNPDKLNVFAIIAPSMIIYLLGILVMILFIWLFSRHERNRNEELYSNRKLSETDELTGVFNRHAYENRIVEVRNNDMEEEFAIIMIDINGLKTVNDTIGHKAGDELIVGAANCISKAFEEIGTIYRIGGDEFIIITESDEMQFNSAIRKFEELVSEWKGELVPELTVSYGVAEHNIYKDFTVDELIKEADRLMYISKNEYYRRTGKDRRMAW